MGATHQPRVNGYVSRSTGYDLESSMSTHRIDTWQHALSLLVQDHQRTSRLIILDPAGFEGTSRLVLEDVAVRPVSGLDPDVSSNRRRAMNS